MSNVIDLLERMGQDARLRHASQDEVEFALAGAQIDPGLRAAIVAKDQTKLEMLLGTGNLCCMQFPAKEEEDGDDEESPSREGEEISLQSVFQIRRH